ncbi:MAG: ribosome recycling factor [Myxococcota bacterium]|jgi:ribosome recycling factor|nr:ribosome recycling factor [Myxococcota bacterium]
MAEEDLELVYEEAKDAMEKSVKSFRKDLLRIRTGRASTALLDGIMVEYYGAATPLNQLANLSAPDPRMLVVTAFDKAALGDIERAIQASELGLNPANDGKVIRITIPPLTEERRKELVKQVRKSAEEHKVGVREARRDAMGMLKDLEGDGSLPKDDRHRADKHVQDVTDEYVGQIDKLTEQKEQEVLEV